MKSRTLPTWSLLLSLAFHGFCLLALLQVPQNHRPRLSPLRAIHIKMAPSLKLQPPPPPSKSEVSQAIPSTKSSKKEVPSQLPTEKVVPQSRPPLPKPTPAKKKRVSPPLSMAGTSLHQLDAPEFGYDYYIQQFISRISANWFRPPAKEGTSCVIYFRIASSGSIKDIRVETSSGIPAFDRAALRAIYSANPLPPLPYGFKKRYLGVHLKFE